MKKVLILLAILAMPAISFTQNLGINDDGSVPNSKAMIDVKSTTKGFLPPRMTYAERNVITGAPAGLIIWCSNCGASGEMQVYNGAAWTNMTGGAATDALVIGNDYQGGKIAYILQPDDPGYVEGQVHGLIAAPSDQSDIIRWYDGYPILIGTETALGTGNANTNIIVTILGPGSYAAKLCSDLVLGEYSDWYLPSKDELNKLYLNQTAIGGFADNIYWSSSESYEYPPEFAWNQNFYNGVQEFCDRHNMLGVRAVRAF